MRVESYNRRLLQIGGSYCITLNKENLIANGIVPGVIIKKIILEVE